MIDQFLERPVLIYVAIIILSVVIGKISADIRAVKTPREHAGRPYKPQLGFVIDASKGKLTGLEQSVQSANGIAKEIVIVLAKDDKIGNKVAQKLRKTTQLTIVRKSEDQEIGKPVLRYTKASILCFVKPGDMLDENSLARLSIFRKRSMKGVRTPVTLNFRGTLFSATKYAAERLTNFYGAQTRTASIIRRSALSSSGTRLRTLESPVFSNSYEPVHIRWWQWLAVVLFITAAFYGFQGQERNLLFVVLTVASYVVLALQVVGQKLTTTDKISTILLAPFSIFYILLKPLIELSAKVRAR